MQVDQYPPLTPLSEYPLHGWDYGSQYACQRPEDPNCTVFDWRCPSCLLAAEASVENCGDQTVQWKQDADTPEREVTLSWLIDRSCYWLWEQFDHVGMAQDLADLEATNPEVRAERDQLDATIRDLGQDHD